MGASDRALAGRRHRPHGLVDLGRVGQRVDGTALRFLSWTARSALGLFGSVVACGSPRMQASAPQPGGPTPSASLATKSTPNPSASSPLSVRPFAPNAVHGTVVDENRRPLGERIVAIGAERTTTDADGRFVLARVAPVYGIVVVEPGGARATVYQGLRRRDPVLVHKAIRSHSGAHRATIEGRIDGGPFGANDWVQLTFSSKQGVSHAYLGATPGSRPGPDYGPLYLSWDGPDAISGDLFALRTKREPITQGTGGLSDGGAFDGSAGIAPRGSNPPMQTSSWFALEPLTVHVGDALHVDLRPAPLPRLHTQVKVRAEGKAHPTQVSEYYALRGVHGVIPADGARYLSPVYDFDLLDARAFGDALCADAAFSSGSREWRYTRTCDVAIDAPVELTLHEPPSFQQPAPRSSLGPGTTFSWSPIRGGIYELELSDAIPTPSNPTIDVFTTDLSATWPDLRALGVVFPTGLAKYAVKVAGHGPYATLDDAFSPDGMGASFPKTLWLAESAELEVEVSPPPSLPASPAKP